MVDFKQLNKELSIEQVLDLIQQPNTHRQISGDELRTCCPVHGGEHPNFSINIQTKKWKCHSHDCHGTSLLELYAQSKKLDIKKAAEELSEKTYIGGLNQQYFRPSTSPAKTERYKNSDTLECWNNATPKGKDVYFSKKRLKPPPIARFGKNPKGYHSTLIPYCDTDGNLKMVLSCGDKKLNFKASDSSKGAFALLGDLKPSGSFFIGEGIATVQTAWEASERAIAAVSCGTWSNMLPVLDAIKEKYPEARPIVLIDCDPGEVGETNAKKILLKHPEATFRKPSFESLENNSQAKDFNDLISVCGASLDEVKRQLTQEYKINMTATEPLKTNESFSEKLGKIIKNSSFALQLEGRTYGKFEEEHRKLFASGGLVTGYKKIDEKLYFAKGDFCVIQAMSNHGKSSFMLQLAANFLKEEQNAKMKPLCIFATYESMPVAVEAKFLNLLSNKAGEGAMLKYQNNGEAKYLYPSKGDFKNIQLEYNTLLSQKDINFLPAIPLEQLGALVKLYKSENPDRTIVLFLDYFQIISCTSEKTGWELIKEMAYKLESLAINEEIIVITASQVNAERQTREGRDLYNAATTVIDIFNHSHENLNMNQDLKKEFLQKISHKSVCTFSVSKQKHGEVFALKEHLLFNGYHFEEHRQEFNF